MCATSEDLPEPRPPFSTMFNISEFNAALQVLWKAVGKNSDAFLIVTWTSSDIINKSYR